MEETFNRIIRTEPMTFSEALRIAYTCIKEKKEEMELADINHQNLAGDYISTMFALEELFKAGRENITNKFNEEL